MLREIPGVRTERPASRATAVRVPGTYRKGLRGVEGRSWGIPQRSTGVNADASRAVPFLILFPVLLLLPLFSILKERDSGYHQRGKGPCGAKLRQLYFFSSSSSIRDTAQQTQVSSALTIARLKYSGGGDWYNDPSAEVNLLKFVRQNTNIDVNPRYEYVEI